MAMDLSQNAGLSFSNVYCDVAVMSYSIDNRNGNDDATNYKNLIGRIE